MDNHSEGHPHQYQLLLDDSLPVLPSSVRYYDDFEDKYNIINKLDDDEWKTQFDGKKYTVKFIKVPQGVRRAFKHIAIDMLGRLDVKSVIMFLDNILRSNALDALNVLREQQNLPGLPVQALPEHWRDFILAVALIMSFLAMVRRMRIAR